MPKVLAYLDVLGFSKTQDLEKWDGNVTTILQFVNQVEAKLQENLVREQQEQNEGDAPNYVDLDQIAASVKRCKSTFKNLKKRKYNPLPDPDIDDGGRGKKDLWIWSNVKPWLEKEFPGLILVVPGCLTRQN